MITCAKLDSKYTIFTILAISVRGCVLSVDQRLMTPQLGSALLLLALGWLSLLALRHPTSDQDLPAPGSHLTASTHWGQMSGQASGVITTTIIVTLVLVMPIFYTPIMIEYYIVSGALGGIPILA